MTGWRRLPQAAEHPGTPRAHDRCERAPRGVSHSGRVTEVLSSGMPADERVRRNRTDNNVDRRRRLVRCPCDLVLSHRRSRRLLARQRARRPRPRCRAGRMARRHGGHSGAQRGRRASARPSARCSRRTIPARSAIVLVDDHSSDGTADVARRSAAAAGAPDRLTVLSGRTPPRGWTGKLWAMQQGVDRVGAARRVAALSCCSPTPTSPMRPDVAARAGRARGGAASSC